MIAGHLIAGNTIAGRDVPYIVIGPGGPGDGYSAAMYDDDEEELILFLVSLMRILWP